MAQMQPLGWQQAGWGQVHRSSLKNTEVTCVRCSFCSCVRVQPTFWAIGNSSVMLRTRLKDKKSNLRGVKVNDLK